MPPATALSGTCASVAPAPLATNAALMLALSPTAVNALVLIADTTLKMVLTLPHVAELALTVEYTLALLALCDNTVLNNDKKSALCPVTNA